MKKYYFLLITVMFLMLGITKVYAVSFGQVDGTCFMNCMSYQDDISYCTYVCTN